eukprot:1291069-Amphidinium_carterae.1
MPIVSWPSLCHGCIKEKVNPGMDRASHGFGTSAQQPGLYDTGNLQGLGGACFVTVIRKVMKSIRPETMDVQVWGWGRVTAQSSDAVAHFVGLAWVDAEAVVHASVSLRNDAAFMLYAMSQHWEASNWKCVGRAVRAQLCLLELCLVQEVPVWQGTLCGSPWMV